jgi:hypothetical protein
MHPQEPFNTSKMEGSGIMSEKKQMKNIPKKIFFKKDSTF